jgi:hypothetical protein
MEMNDTLMRVLQYRVAKSSVGPSTIQGMGPRGMRHEIVEYLSRIDLSSIPCLPNEYISWLDRQTVQLGLRIKHLPDGDQRETSYRGPARKCLNIFLFQCFLNTFLRDNFGLSAFESLLEVPIDSFTANGIMNEASRLGIQHSLAFETVVHMKAKSHTAFQEVATKVAQEHGHPRVYLDLEFWANKEEMKSCRLKPAAKRAAA